MTFAKLWAWLQTTAAKWIGITLAVLGAFAMIRKSGADSARAQGQKKTIKAVGKRDEINRNIRNSSDDSVNKRLSKWDRD